MLWPSCLFFNTASSDAALSAGPLQSVSCKHHVGAIHYRPDQWERDEPSKPTQSHRTVHDCKSWHTTMNLPSEETVALRDNNHIFDEVLWNVLKLNAIQISEILQKIAWKTFETQCYWDFSHDKTGKMITQTHLVICINHCHFLHCNFITDSIFCPIIFWQWNVHKIYFFCPVSLKKLKQANFFYTYWAFSIIQYLWHKINMISLTCLQWCLDGQISRFWYLHSWLVHAVTRNMRAWPALN